jgi:putative ABC transport system ATP-binding protein
MSFRADILEAVKEEFALDLLKCENVAKTYGSGTAMITALEHVNLSVRKGEFVAIVGASGSGKSTLLHLLGGVDRPTEGKILIEDTDIATLNEEQLAIFRRRKVGLIYQFYNLIPTLDVRKNILLPMLLDSRKPDEERFLEIVKTLGLTDRLSHLPGQLSGGQQQRVAIGRSLIYRPAILLADEPTGNLDRKNSEETIELLKLSNRRFRQTVLLITHDERLALEADRILTIEDGRIISDKAVRK